MIFGMIGGDKRNEYLAYKLKEQGFEIKTYGIGQNVDNCKNVDEVLSDARIIIGPIPMSFDNVKLNSKNDIKIEYILEKLNNRHMWVAGKINSNVADILEQKGIAYIDLLKYEPLTIANSIPTAEGAIKIAIEETDITLHNAEVLVLGYGNAGKVLAKTLKGLGSNVWVEARKEKDIEWIKANDYKPIHLNNLDKYLKRFDIIFNTIPSIILDEQRLISLKKNVLLIELASKPYGIDMETAKKLGIKCILAPGLPGKIAPQTSAEYLYSAIIDLC